MTVVTYPSLWAAYRSHLQTWSSPTAWRLQLGPICCTETPVNDYQHTRCKSQIEDNHVCNCWLRNDVKVFWWPISLSKSGFLLPISHCLSPRKWKLNTFSHGGHVVILHSTKWATQTHDAHFAKLCSHKSLQEHSPGVISVDPTRLVRAFGILILTTAGK